jgi:hypothetical protein
MAFHNAAGMILRGPGHESRRDQNPPGDDRVIAALGATGARMIPHYRNLVTYKDLYPVHGGFTMWTYENLGIFSFTGELWNLDQLLGRAPEGPQTVNRAIGGEDQSGQLFASDRLLFGETFRPWKPFHHPLYGDVEIGGFIKQSQRVPPPFMIEEMCHRNAAFVLYHADQLPHIELDEPEVKPLGRGAVSITATIRNTRMTPTISEQAARRAIGLPDFASLSGEGLEVLAGGRLINRDTGELAPAAAQPERLAFPDGVPGQGATRVRWFVRGRGEATIRYDSQKGGSVTKRTAVGD